MLTIEFLAGPPNFKLVKPVPFTLHKEPLLKQCQGRGSMDEVDIGYTI
jgi:hypothetical protein